MGEFSEPLAAHLAKHAGLLGRLALIMHCLEHGPRAVSIPLSGETMERAERLLSKLVRHAAALFDMLAGENGAAALSRRLALSILAARAESATKNILLQICHPFRKAEEPAQWAAIMSLEDAGWLLPSRGRHYRGRPTGWLVNPQVHVAFAERGDKHRELRRAVQAKLRGGMDE